MRALSRAYRYQFDCPIPAEIIIDVDPFHPLTKEQEFKVAEIKERRRDCAELQSMRVQENEKAIKEEVNEDRAWQLYRAITAAGFHKVGWKERDKLADIASATFGPLAGAITYRNLLLMRRMGLCRVEVHGWMTIFRMVKLEYISNSGARTK